MSPRYIFNSLVVTATALALILINPFALQSRANQSQIDVPRTGLDREVIYFVMPDRYRNGDPNNDQGPGYDPTHTAFFHGGDLKGLTGSCDPKDAKDDGLVRLKRLGFTTIWLTPLVAQQPPTEGGAGYHGYWGVDFLNVEPRLGSNQDLESLSACAKKLGLKLVLDVVTNHTGDIVWYEGRRAYIPEKYKEIKNPAWLNDISNYHNVGDMRSCWSEGSCMRDGDFYGLDDLATEKEVVYRGFADVYGEWIKRYGFVGFRVDTARHLDNEFFKRWDPLIRTSATSSGISDFTIFGEVWETVPIELMNFVRINQIQTVLDFPFQRVAVEYAAASSDGETLRNLFEYDDYYTTANSSAQNLVTFLGNHDMGRVAFLIEGKKRNPDSELLPRVKLAHALLYLSRGIPVVYYGDEVGMTGSESGNDQRARQDMFATKVTMWKTEKRVGSEPIGSRDSFSQRSHPISRYLARLAKLRSEYPALSNGQMQVRLAKGPIFALSKRDHDSSREYLVIFNNSAKTSTALIPTATRSSWREIFGKAKVSTRGTSVEVVMPPLTTLVLEAKREITETRITLEGLKAKEDFLTGFQKVTASVKSNDLSRAEFFIEDGSSWRSLGVDLNRPFNVYVDPNQYSGQRRVKVLVVSSKGERYESKPITLSMATP
jgi:glycosidase